MCDEEKLTGLFSRRRSFDGNPDFRRRKLSGSLGLRLYHHNILDSENNLDLPLYHLNILDSDNNLDLRLYHLNILDLSLIHI